MNDLSHVLVTENDRVLTIAWNRPDKKNALTQAMYEVAANALQSAQDDANIRAVLLTGTENCFTAGNDLSDFINNPPADDSSPVMRFIHAIVNFEKPLLAAVNGPAVGIGTTMLLHCDLVVAADSAVFCLPFAKLGLCPEAASSFLLPLFIGHQRASELLLLGESFDVIVAKECGLVNRVASSENYLSIARELALHVASMPPSSMRATKALIKSHQKDIVGAAYKTEMLSFGKMLHSPEAKEAMTAFMERRAPDFSSF